jgi:hypothetical protein
MECCVIGDDFEGGSGGVGEGREDDMKSSKSLNEAVLGGVRGLDEFPLRRWLRSNRENGEEGDGFETRPGG